MKPSDDWAGLSTSRASRIMPAHVPKIGLPAAWNFSSAGTNSHVSISLSSVVLSPPGMISPATWSSWPGIRTSTEGTPILSRAARWSAKSPWSASTPIAMVTWPEATMAGPRGRSREVDASSAHYQPRVWRSSDSFSLDVSMPGIASPRSSDTRASTSGSL